MLEALQNLNASPGIKGSLIVAPDGLVITSCLGPGVDDETTAALTSDMVGGALQWLRTGDFPDLQQMVLNSSRGKIVVHAAGSCFLVVLTGQFINIDVTHLEIASAARAIARRAILSN